MHLLVAHLGLQRVWGRSARCAPRDVGRVNYRDPWNKSKGSEDHEEAWKMPEQHRWCASGRWSFWKGRGIWEEKEPDAARWDVVKMAEERQAGGTGVKDHHKGNCSSIKRLEEGRVRGSWTSVCRHHFIRLFTWQPGWGYIDVIRVITEAETQPWEAQGKKTLKCWVQEKKIPTWALGVSESFTKCWVDLRMCFRQKGA